MDPLGLEEIILHDTSNRAKPVQIDATNLESHDLGKGQASQLRVNRDLWNPWIFCIIHYIFLVTILIPLVKYDYF